MPVLRFPNVRNIKDENACGGIFDGADQRIQHLIQCDEAEAASACARRGNQFKNPIGGNKGVWPAVSGTKGIPRAQNGRVHAAGAQQRFAFGAHSEVVFHHGRGLSNADINKVLNLCFDSGGDRGPGGREINGAKLLAFGWTRMRNADKLDERVGRLDFCRKRFFFERVAGDDFAAGGQFILGTLANEGADFVTPREEQRDEPRTHVAGAPGEEDFALSHAWI